MRTVEKLGWVSLGLICGYAVQAWRQRAKRNHPQDGHYSITPRPFQDEWGVIGERYPKFASVLSDLLLSLRGLVGRTVRTSTPADRLVFTLAQIAIEDFLQILFLCRHGFGIGGLQILRSLYERCVTMAYISATPEEADTFFAYHAINQGKVLHHARDLGQLPLLGLSADEALT